MLIAEAKKRIANFCAAALNDKSIKIGYSNQFAPEFVKPCVMIDVDNCKDVSTCHTEINNNAVTTQILWKTIDVEFKAFKATEVGSINGADDILCTIFNALKTEQAESSLGQDLAYAYTLQDISNIPDVVDSKVESRAVMTLRFNMAQLIQSQSSGIIRSIQGVSVIDDLKNNLNIKGDK